MEDKNYFMFWCKEPSIVKRIFLIMALIVLLFVLLMLSNLYGSEKIAENLIGFIYVFLGTSLLLSIISYNYSNKYDEHVNKKYLYISKEYALISISSFIAFVFYLFFLMMNSVYTFFIGTLFLTIGVYFFIVSSFFFIRNIVKY